MRPAPSATTPSSWGVTTTTRAGRTAAGVVFSSLQPVKYTQAMQEQRNGTDAKRMEASRRFRLELIRRNDYIVKLRLSSRGAPWRKIDLARRAEIGSEKRARTRAQIVEAGLVLLAERPPEALTVDAIVEAAGVAKGTFYYHFQSVEELVAAVGAKPRR